MKNRIVYVLSAIHPRIARNGKRGNYEKDKYDSVSSYAERVGVFSSVKEAEKVIKTLVKQEKESSWRDWYNEYFGFILDGVSLDNPLYGHDESYRNVSHFESRRTYLDNGILNCCSDLDDRCTKKFRGRKDPITKIKRGDIALVCYGNEIEPVLVGENAMTDGEWKERMNKHCYGDVTDDSGIVFTVNHGHEHPFSPNVFPITCLPFYSVKKVNVNRMKKMMKDYYDGKAL